MKFKVGDRVAVYCDFPFKGKVSSILESDEADKYLFVTEDGFYSSHNDAPFHYKQCRKLIKKANEKSKTNT